MSRQLNEIWKIEMFSTHPWRAQMKNYVAQFETEEQAQRYVAALKKIEAQRQAKQ